ncbi:MAG: hypothetical protein WC782_08525 [Methylococcaceae bacterium]|jgi:DNA-directed RNA polymerase specialized sigma54-like protein
MEAPEAQHRPPAKPLSHYVQAFLNPQDGIRKTYETGAYTMQQIAQAFGVHYSTISRKVNKNCRDNA